MRVLTASTRLTRRVMLSLTCGTGIILCTMAGNWLLPSNEHALFSFVSSWWLEAIILCLHVHIILHSNYLGSDWRFLMEPFKIHMKSYWIICNLKCWEFYLCLAVYGRTNLTTEMTDTASLFCRLLHRPIGKISICDMVANTNSCIYLPTTTNQDWI